MKSIYAALFCAFICLAANNVQAQKTIKEGQITYAVEYDLPPDQQMAAAMLPKEYTIYFKGDKSKFTIDMGMMKSVVLSDAKTMEGLVLMDVPAAGQKIALKTTKADKEEQQRQIGDQEIVKTSETKTISGYQAVKYTATDKKSGNVSEIWATKDLIIPDNEFSQFYKTIEGTLLTFSTKMNGVSLMMNFKDIKQEAVPDISLTVPEGYTVKTVDELKSMSGQ